LIDHLRGKPAATSFLSTTRIHIGLATNSVVIAELLSGARNLVEQKEIDRLIAVFHIHPIEPIDCDRSLALLRLLKLSHGIGWHDCLLAVSALRLNLAVATLNDRHFAPVPGLRVHRPY
jgi:predicted nucleic acid-binding protein